MKTILPVFLLATVCGAATFGAEDVYTMTPDEYGMVVKAPDGRTVCRYMTKKPEKTNLSANSVCCLYPVFTPKGVRAVDMAPGDHRHHRGIFLAWHAMQCGEDRADFWGWGEMAPTETRVIVNRSVDLVNSSAKRAVIAVKNDWKIGDKVVMEEHTRILIGELNGMVMIGQNFEFLAKDDIQLDQTAFGGFCVKGRKDGEAAYFGPDGKISLPNPHHLKPETDWPAAAWYDYVVELESGETIGVAVLNHPSNPPSTWHNLKPIAMVNPCIVAPGAVKIKKGETLRLRYGVVVHDGPVPTETLNQLTDMVRSR